MSDAKKLIERLRKFLDVAAGEGHVCGGIDAADLFDEIDLIEQQAARIAELDSASKDAIRREALEEAAKVCDALSTDYNSRRRTSDNPTYLEGKSDGAEACASALYRAIRDLSQKKAGE
ncbi:hypothetical protein [Paraburkholderia phenoliruptrix]|uniref:hypothetical protein n=1 Tax=Paraburkholderia phenoliruptrix TaxID=252970 RepID=UPI002854E7D3|nr:hypothetical protein [Paraburkholderia phenoliruptrix]MDR6393478.1 hypothetical protein [Paraburkholderia phenoliruptrix]